MYGLCGFLPSLPEILTPESCISFVSKPLHGTEKVCCSRKEENIVKIIWPLNLKVDKVKSFEAMKEKNGLLATMGNHKMSVHKSV